MFKKRGSKYEFRGKYKFERVKARAHTTIKCLKGESMEQS